MWFKKKATKEEFEELKQILTKSFDRIKVDIDYLNNKTDCLEDKINNIEFTARVTARSTARVTARSKLKVLDKDVLKKFDKVKLIDNIIELSNKGLRTTQLRDEIKERFDIKDRCFYNYLKIAKNQLNEVKLIK